MEKLLIKSARLVVPVYRLDQLPAGNQPEIALVGRSNVGKSSFINRLTARKGLARTSGTPGKTQSINFYLINDSWHLVDLPGYGYARTSWKQQAAWSRLIDGYLRNRPQLVGLAHLVDIRHPALKNDLEMREWVRSIGINNLVIATKADKISRGQRAQKLKAIKEFLDLEDGQVRPFSAVTGEGMDDIKIVFNTWLQV